MRVGTLEIQMMASMARLSKDMNEAQRVVGGAMGNVERSVAKAKQAMQALGVGLPIAMITDQVRRMTDQYTKLDAQLRLATKSQQQYAQGMSDIRRISSIAQSDINATSMLYTRLINVMDGTGVSQAKLATVTETVSFGLKAYGATAQEASSAALQLSQAMGANRLGGEEFRAVMEAMPNVMKVLAQSMGVPLGELRALSIAGKITADEMVKAFGNPAVAAEFKRLALSAQTVTGAWTVARNELMMLVGELAKTTGATGGVIAVFDAMGAVFRFLADNISTLTNVLIAYVSVLGGKFIVGMVQARAAQMALNAAHAEAITVNTAMAASEAANALAAKDAAAARALNLSGTAALNAAKTEATAVNLALARTENVAAIASRAAALAEVERATARAKATFNTEALIAANAGLVASNTRLAATELAVARAEEAAAIAAKDAAVSRGVETVATNALVAANARLTASTAAVSAAEKLQAAGSIGIIGKIKGLVGKAGWIGMAIFGAWSVFDFLNGMQAVADGADKLKSKFDGLSLAEAQSMRQKEFVKMLGMRGTFGDVINEKEIRQSQDLIRSYDREIAKMVEAANAGQQVKRANIALSHDQQVAQNRMIDLAKQYNDGNLTGAEYLARVNDALHGKIKAVVANTKAEDAAEKQRVAALDSRVAYWQSVTDETAAINEKAAQLELEISLIGVTAEQEAALTMAKYNSAIATNEQLLATELLNNGRDSDIRAIALQIEALYRLRDAAGMKPIVEANTRAAQAAIDEQKKAHEELWKSIESVAHSTWTKVWEGGRDAFTNIGKTIKSAILDMLYQMTVKKWIISIGASMTGVGAGTAMAGDMLGGASGGTSGVGSWLSAGQTIYSAISNGFTNIGVQVATAVNEAGIAMGSQAVQAASSTIGLAATYIGAGLAGISLGTMIAGDKVALGMDGKTSSIMGTAIGMALGGPIGGVVGGALGGVFNAAFGMGAKTPGTTTLAGQFSGAGFSGQYQTPWTQKGGWFRSNKSGVDTQGVPAEQTSAMNNVLAGTVSVFGNLALVAGGALKSLDGWSFAFNRQVSTQEQQNQLIIDMADSMGTFLIPELQAFRKEGENLADTAVRMADTFRVTDGILALVGGTFGSVGLASMGMRNNLVELLGGLQQAGASMDAYYQAFYSDTERVNNGWKTMFATLRAAGIDTLPTTNAEYRKLVDAQDLATLSGQDMFATLIKLAPTFDGLTKSTEGLMNQIGLLTTSSFRTLIDYTRYLSLAVGTPSSGIIAAQAAAAPSIPAFATGGSHIGGARLVGENGPEIEFTGPSRIASNSESRSLLDVSGVIESVDALRSELRAIGIAVSGATQKTAKILDRWDGDGMPEVRVVA